MDDHEESGSPSDLTRRDFLRTMGSTAAAAAVTGCASMHHDSPAKIAEMPNIQGAVKASRVPFLSQPKQVVKLIKAAAESSASVAKN